MVSKCPEGGGKVTQGQADQATGAHLRVHNDRETPLPDTSSHAESIR